jgi:hypothetical protein
MDFPTDLYFLDARHRTRSKKTCATETKKSRKGGDAFDKRLTILKRLSHEIMIVKTVGLGAAKQAWGVVGGARNNGFCIKGCVTPPYLTRKAKKQTKKLHATVTQAH